jgi:hypothetical protein
MRRLACLALLVVALPLAAAETWVTSYNRGVDAVRANHFQAGADLLQRAIAETPSENAAARVRDQIFTYVPHFWLGVARLNLGDPDAAIREWKTSEEQGAIQNTPYYAQLREWIGRAASEKQRRAEAGATDSKKQANAAVQRAVSAQMDAVGAGADRSDAYRAAQRKLQEAIATNAHAGIDIHAYQRAADLAGEAQTLFASAGEEAKRVKASRPAVVKPPPVRKAGGEVVVPFDDAPVKQAVAPPQVQPQPKALPPQPAPQPVAVATQTVPPVKAPAPQPAIESEALVAARLAVQQYRRHLLAMHLPVIDAQHLERELKPDADARAIRRIAEQVATKERELDARAAAAVQKPQVVEVAAAAPANDALPRLQSAYRAFAGGDLASAEQMLTQLLSTKENGEAYLLRGCTRYTRAMLARNGAPVLAAATNDFRAALRLNRALRLDRAAWSPKLVAFFEGVKK